MAIRFNKDKVKKNLHLLNIVRIRADLYNRAMKKYTESPYRVPMPTNNLKDLVGKYSTAEEYINSGKTWKKLLEFDESTYSFEEWVNYIIGHWNKVRFILGDVSLPLVPIFDIVMSPKLAFVVEQIKADEKKIEEANKDVYVNNSAATSKINSIDMEIVDLLYYHEMNPDMSINDILDTFRRDFTPLLSAVIEKLRERGYDDEKILIVLGNKISNTETKKVEE